MIDKPCKKSDCTACYACANICPVNCIEIKMDESNAHYPQIDEKKCIHCRMCEKVCPANNKLDFRLPREVYAAHSTDSNVQKSSTSGGTASTISKQFIMDGGVVYTTSFSDSLKVNFKKYDTIDALKNAQGSKYVHAHTGYIFKAIKKDLRDGKKILFIATPCQISGLNCFLKDEKTDNLFTIDLICHGTPDRETFSAYSKGILKNDFGKAERVLFRDGNDYVLKYLDKNNNILKQLKVYESFYLSHFLDGFSYRKNCYSCPYARKERVSDITLGDFWGLGEELEFEGSKENGINAVLVNTQKGEALLNLSSKNLTLYKRTLEEAVKGNSQLRHPCTDNSTSQKFRQISKSKGAEAALKKCNIKKYVLLYLRKCIHNHKVLYKICLKIPYIKDKIF